MQIEPVGDYLKAEDLGSKKEITIGEKFEYAEGKYGRKLNVEVLLHDGTKKTWTPNGKSINFLRSTMGIDSKDWINKKVKMQIVKQSTSNGLKDVLYPEGAI